MFTKSSGKSKREPLPGERELSTYLRTFLKNILESSNYNCKAHEKLAQKKHINAIQGANVTKLKKFWNRIESNIK